METDRRHRSRGIILGGGLAFGLLAATAAQAQDAPAGLDAMIRSMEQISQGMTGGIASVAIRLLYTMAALEMAWTFGKGAIQGEGFAALLLKMIVRAVVVGLFYFCLTWGDDLVRLAIDSAIAVAGVAGIAAEPTPSGILSQALSTVGRILGELSILSPGHSVGLVLVGMAVIITAAAMAAMIVLVYAELYLMAVAGLLALGFGGLDATRDMAVNYIRMLVAKGFKLLTLLVVNGMVMGTLDTAFQAAGDNNLFGALQLLIVQIVGLVLMLHLPSAVEGLVGGGGNAAATIGGGFTASLAGRALMTGGTVAAGAAYGGARGGVMGARTAAGGSFADAAETPMARPQRAGTAATAAAAIRKAASSSAPVAKGAALGATGGALTGFTEGPQNQIKRDVMDFLNRKSGKSDG